jgi:hypothetical protein
MRSGAAAGSNAWCVAACSTPVEVQGALPGSARGGRAIGPESKPMGFCGPEVLDACHPIWWCWRRLAGLHRGGAADVAAVEPVVGEAAVKLMEVS